MNSASELNNKRIANRWKKRNFTQNYPFGFLRASAESFSKLFYTIGILSVSFAIVLTYQRFNPTRLAFAGQVTSAATIDAKYAPSEISIPSLSVKLPVFSSTIVDGKWDASSVGVNYLVTSPLPGTTGNSILYGHNWSGLLGKLSDIEKDAIIFVSYPNGQTKEFRVLHTSVVDPEDIGILGRTTDKRITLYTCTGFLDSKRFVVTAMLSE